MAKINDGIDGRKPVAETGNGLNEAVLAGRGEEDSGGSGGDSGGGTMAGAGEPSGGLLSSSGATMAGLTNDHIAAEASSLGPADGSLDEGGEHMGAARRPTGAEALGDEAARAPIGSGAPPDRSETGSAGPIGPSGGAGPAGAASPGGDSRR